MATINNKWRLSASIILVSPANKIGGNFNVLMLKRSDSSSAANDCVFPGGQLDPIGDESVAWLDYFQQFGVPESTLRRLVLISDNRVELFAPQGTGCYDRFFKRSKIWAREITLRLTALRECFEEVGVLLCRTREQLTELDKEELQSDFHAYQHANFDRESWQRRVHNDPKQFLELCRELQVVPDLWALYEWSAWATPAAFQKRYEVALFIAFLNNRPSLLAESLEVKECLCQTPLELLLSCQHGKLSLPGPQLYELTRLLTISDYAKLLTFAAHYAKLGCTLITGVLYTCTDGTVSAMPGDDLFVAEPQSITESFVISETVAEVRARSKNLHRFETKESLSLKFNLNLLALKGHLPPKNYPIELQKL